MKTGDLFPVAFSESIAANQAMGVPCKDVRARFTGEIRPPKKGEWFLSGGVVEAYQAYQDMTTGRHIAVLVKGAYRWVEDE